MKFEDKHYINTLEKLEWLKDELTKANPEYLAFDTETNGLLHVRNVVVGFSISWNSKDGYYIPIVEWKKDPASKKIRIRDGKRYECYMNGNFVRVWDGAPFEEYEKDVYAECLNPIKLFLEFFVKPRKLLMHNAPFDCKIVRRNFNVDLTPNLHCDTLLLKHVIDENTPLGLKQTASLWQNELGFNPEEDARAEQKEMFASVFTNGGELTGNKQIWRADPLILAKYAIADTALTYGVYEVGMRRFKTEFKDKHLDWFFNQEVMPLCRDVVIPMQYAGTYIDVNYFKEVEKETREILENLEDEIISKLGDLLNDFRIGKSLEDSVKERNIVEAIIELEGLPYPTKMVKGVEKKSLDQGSIKAIREKHPHWLWSYMMGEDEIKYSSAKLAEIKADIYRKKQGRRHRFNIMSFMHLRWLFFTKLGEDATQIPKTKNSDPNNPVPMLTSSVLKQFFSKKYEFVPLLIKYRKLHKLMSTYVEPALALHNGGWLNMDIMQAGTISGRFSFRGGFNLQTLPRVNSFGECPKCEKKNIKANKTAMLLIHLECPDCGYDEEVTDASGIKKGFIAPPGYKIINADFESLEPKCFAFMSGDKKLKEIFWKGLDMYSKIYCDIEDEEGRFSPDPKSPNFLKKKSPDKRNMVKPVVLGIPYGARAPQVAKLMGFIKKETDESGNEVERLDVERGKRFRERYLSTYKDLYKYMVRCELEAMSKGYVETIVGRRRHFELAPVVYEALCEASMDVETFLDMSKKKLEQHSPTNRLNRKLLGKIANFMGIDFIDLLDRGAWAYVRALFKNELNNAKNFPIQALAAHIANKSMLDITYKFRQNNINGYVFLQVHDEISCYVIEEQAEAGAKLLRESMEKNSYANLLDINMKADPTICESLKESK